ncbi:MAG: Fe-S oxidoreductase [Myxococcota bacterium]|jgi:Fe-S oxidoreductase
MSEMRWLPMVAALLAAFGYFALVMQGKTRLLFKAEHRTRFFSSIPRRAANVMTYAFGQKKMFKEKGAGTMHAFIFWGFLVLQIRTFYLILCGFDPSLKIPLIHHGYAFVKDITEIVVLVMIGWALWRRLVTKPVRLSFSGEALLILYMLAALMISDFMVDGMAFSIAQLESGYTDAMFFDWSVLTTDALRFEAVQTEMAWAPVGAFFGSLFSGMSHSSLVAFQEIFYWTHIFIVLTLLNVLPGSKHFHVITAIPNVFFSDTGIRPIGALEPILDLEHQETFGVGEVTDFTWSQYLDLYSCTECGRCQVNCPTVITGKALNPKNLITDIRDHLYAREKEILAGDTDMTGWEVPPHDKTLIEDVNYDAIWACTSCRACSEACPVMIEHVDKIVDLRRHLVLMEANFPVELGATLKNLENKGNPWGLPSGDRAKWAEGLAIPHLTDAPEAEYVFWVGCAGAYDEGQKKVSRALVDIMRQANVSFAILGGDEGCTGDPARRAGNEYLFQMQAQANVEMLRGYDLHKTKKKLVTHCPHCFNTIKNEYPQFGGEFEIVHHSVLIERLISDGKITPKKTPEGVKRVTYHDSCYIGRYNDVYEQPRNALKSIPGIELREMARNKTTGMCCGAGGARVWMEEHDGTRINHTRVEQAMETEADTIAVACPFCHIMMEDGIGTKGAAVQSKDVALLVLESL